MTPGELQNWLEWASARLLAMPGTKIKPADSHVVWPEFQQNKFEILDFRARITLRALAPSSDEIPIMDEILLLPNLCPNEQMRRAVRSRSLVDPLNGRHLFTWIEVAEKVGVARQYTAKRLFTRGLDKIVALTPTSRAAQISTFMSERVI